jgi:outer membrane protein assembly factor BamB
MQAETLNPLALLPFFTPAPQRAETLSETASPEPFRTAALFTAPPVIPTPQATLASLAETPAPQPPETAVTEEPPATAAPTPTFMPALTMTADEKQSPAAMGITEAAYQGAKRQDAFVREVPINVQGGGLYTYYPGGVFTFRSDGMRQNAAFGTAGMPLEQLSVKWQTELGSLRTADSGTLYGLGWTGQPAIIKWSIEVRQMMNLNEAKKGVTALKEVIFAAQDGKVYFLDLADGQPTREAIDIGFPLKGSVAVDAIGRPMIAFGQGISKLPGKEGAIGFYIYNLIDQTKLTFINGRKSKNQLQYATNGAFDGTGLFDRQSDSLVVAGENGLLYTVKLNSVFDFRDAKTLTIDPEITYLRSKGNQNDLTVSMESSVAMYGAYAFTADKQGIIRAVDTTSMKTVWAFDAGDNTDATIALDLEDDTTLALYTGTTVHARSRRDGKAVIRRLNALTGEEVWAYQTAAGYDETERGGVKASPVVGQGELGGLVFFTINKTPEGGSIVALDKGTGALVWSLPLSAGAISSPVAVYADDGRGRIIQADLEGKLYLIEGLTGQVKHTLDLKGTIEGSPAVYNDVLVIGTMDSGTHSMYGIRIE